MFKQLNSLKFNKRANLSKLKYPDARLKINLALLECFFFSLMVASTESYINYFAVKAGITNFELAILAGGPLCLGAFAQLIFPRFIKEKDLQLSIVLSQMIQAIGLVGVIYSSFYGFEFIPTLISLSVYWVGGSACGPLWLDWIGGLFPRKFYRYFLSQKGRLICITTLVCYPLFSIFMKEIPWLKPWHLFNIGFIARISSTAIQVYLGSKVIIQTPIKNTQINSSKVIFNPSYFDNFLKKFLIFFGLLGVFKFSVNISSPFFLPYMIKELHFSQLQFAFLTTIPLLAKVLFGPFWAKRAYGKRTLKIMHFSSLMVGITPLLWVFSGNIIYLSLVEFYSGVFWSAFELGIILLIQQAVLAAPRTLLGEQMAFLNLFGLAGSMLGARLLGNGISSHNLFWLSTTLRISSSLLLIYFSTKIFMKPLKLQERDKYLNVIPTRLRRRFLKEPQGILPTTKKEQIRENEKIAS